MKEIKLLHVSDVHLGSEFSSIPEKQEERQKEILRTFRKITQLCAKESVDVMLIAGDLFEGANVRPDIVKSVKSYLEEAPCKVFISPGNHDYVAMDSPYEEEGWPNNVKIFSGKMERILLPELGVAVYGAGFESTYVKTSLFDANLPVEEEMINLCILHGDLVSDSQTSEYHGITSSALVRSKMDYVALGHIHMRSPIRKEGKTYFAYAGCPEGRGFDELGEKGVYIGTVRKDNVNLAFKPMNQRMYLIEEIDVSHLQNEIAAEVYILNYLKDLYCNDYKDHFYRVKLRGAVPEANALNWKNIELALKDELYYISLVDETVPSVNYEEVAKETSLKGFFVKKLLEEMAMAEQINDVKAYEKIKKALEFGMRAFEGQVELHDY